jgi:oligoribonuclease NrnB/cAMP/cGMP phosphodiesterase (DHH superfamily)
MGTSGPSSSENGTDEKNANLMKALSDRSQQVVHLTHNDLDAVGGDAIHRMKFGDVFTIFASVGKFLPMLDAVAGAPGRGDILSISDLGYQDGVGRKLKKAKSNGWVIEWRDHHKWRDEEIGEIERIVQTLHLDTTVCATGIVARDLMPGDGTAAEVARVVCDYDLWRHEDPRSKMLGQLVMRRQYREYVRDLLMEGTITDTYLEREYTAIMEEMNAKIRKSIRNTKVYGTKYRIAFAPLYGYPSETAHSIRDELGTDIEVIVSDTGRFSIRSVPPVSHLIARKFGGGGHPPAAGGSFPFSFLDRLRFLLFKRTPHYQRLVDVAESL